jgi:hypothetical protein
VRLWDVRTGKAVWAADAGGAVWGLTFSPNGKTVATGQGDGRVVLRDAGTGEETRSLPRACDQNYQPSFSPDGRLLLCPGALVKEGKQTRGVRLWDAATGRLLREWSDTGASAAFIPGRDAVAVLGPNGVISVWELKAGAAPPAGKPGAGDPCFGRLVDELLEKKRTDGQVVEAVFLAVLGRFPGEAEAGAAAAQLAGKRDRRNAVEDLVSALTNSKDYAARLDALLQADPRKQW